MGISDSIAEFIDALINDGNGVAELQRARLAGRFQCVPSQINYVITTRFSPERGYLVESRRGGGGYIRISRIQYDRPSLIMHTINAVGDALDVPTASAFLSNLTAGDVLSQQEARLLSCALSDRALSDVPTHARDAVRAQMLKCALTALI